MTEEQIEEIYYTMLGQLLRSPWSGMITNLFEDGSECDLLYGDVYDANVRLVERLGMEDEDDDVEIIIDSLLRIGELQSYEMFRCGWNLAKAQENHIPLPE